MGQAPKIRTKTSYKPYDVRPRGAWEIFKEMGQATAGCFKGSRSTGKELLHLVIKAPKPYKKTISATAMA